MRIAQRLLCPQFNEKIAGPGKRPLLIVVLSLFLLLPVFTNARNNDAPPITVSGKVTDAGGQVVSGVSVLEKGTSNGSVTDANGRYQITVKGENAILVFSIVGFAAQEVKVGSQTNIDVVLKSDATQLQDVVVKSPGLFNGQGESR
jgi:hypothetical protein